MRTGAMETGASSCRDHTTWENDAHSRSQASRNEMCVGMGARKEVGEVGRWV